MIVFFVTRTHLIFKLLLIKKSKHIYGKNNGYETKVYFTKQSNTRTHCQTIYKLASMYTMNAHELN